MAFTTSDDDPFTILEEFNRSDATYLHLKTPEFELTLSRLTEVPGVTAPSVGQAARPVAEEVDVDTNVDADADADTGAATEDVDLFTVRAPLVGAFYAAPKPGEPPFVEVGVEVQPDTTVGVLEAMKVFTAVLAETSGVVAEIPVRNGEFVEFGQPLMTVRRGGQD